MHFMIDSPLWQNEELQVFWRLWWLRRWRNVTVVPMIACVCAWSISVLCFALLWSSGLFMFELAADRP